MSVACSGQVERDGWRFLFPTIEHGAPADGREALVEAVIETIAGRRGDPFRRSRHATTWAVEAGDGQGGRVDVFVKEMNPPRGAFRRIKRLFRATQAEHVVRIVEQLRRDGFGAPCVLLTGLHRGSGRELLVTRRLAGSMVTRVFNPRHAAADRATRRAVLHALGLEIARFHEKGYVHGDLTPYNVLIVSREPIRFAFIDHERTRRVGTGSPVAQWHRMRNLVQLGRFDLPGITLADRMRVFTSYVGARGLPPRKTLRRLARMIERRLTHGGAHRSRGASYWPQYARKSEARNG
jgi:Lipopolysaccharide kinase (Kdo/WaaP) family